MVMVAERPRATVSESGQARCVIDRAHLARFTLGDLPLEIEVLGLFIAQAPQTLAQLESASTDKAWREAAHTLKGSARAVGAWRVGDLAQKAEAFKSPPEALVLKSIISDLAAALNEAKAYIDGLQTDAGPASVAA